MSDLVALDRARQEFAAGQHAAALRSAWKAVQSAMLRHDEQTIGEAAELAQQISTVTSGREREDSERLTGYCRAILDGVGGGVAAPSALGRMFGLGRREKPRPRTRCPECAEDISADAKVCRYCGHRLDSTR